jgi:hypothetical protein
MFSHVSVYVDMSQEKRFIQNYDSKIGACLKAFLRITARCFALNPTNTWVATPHG